MTRQLTVGAALCALVASLVLAPTSHVHPADPAHGDGHHGRLASGAVRHSHLSPHDSAHAHHSHDAGDAEHCQEDAEVVSTTVAFLLKAVERPGGLTPFVVSSPVLVAAPVSGMAAVPMSESRAHAPPAASPGPSRAPPAITPAQA